MDTGVADTAKLTSEMRAYIHDMRNFFSVVGSAQRMLLRDPDVARLDLIARALEHVARDGIALTTRLLAQTAEAEQKWCDPGKALRDLEVMLVPLGGPRTLIRVETGSDVARIGIGLLDIQAIALEMVSNSLAAGAHRVSLRGHKAAGRYWLLGVDDGRGCDGESALGAFIAEGGIGAAHGSGLNRIGRALREAGGIARIRSEPSKGCAIGLAFPLLVDPEVETAI